jgi:hypothetical protein
LRTGKRPGIQSVRVDPHAVDAIWRGSREDRGSGRTSHNPGGVNGGQDGGMPDYAASGVVSVVTLLSASFCFGIVRLSMRQRNRSPFAPVSKRGLTRCGLSRAALKPGSVQRSRSGVHGRATGSLAPIAIVPCAAWRKQAFRGGPCRLTAF